MTDDDALRLTCLGMTQPHHDPGSRISEARRYADFIKGKSDPLVEALRFYADVQNYQEIRRPCSTDDLTPVIVDQGQMARHALAQLPPPPAHGTPASLDDEPGRGST